MAILPRSAVILRGSHSLTLVAARTFSSSITSLEEAMSQSSRTPTPQLNAAALRRRMEGSQNRRGGGDGSSRPSQDRRVQGARGSGVGANGQGERGARGGYGDRTREGSAGRGGAGQRSGGQNRGQQRGGRGGSSYGNSRTSVRSSSNREWDPSSAPSAPIQSIITTTNWNQAISTASLGVNRVPYTIPTSTLESLRQGVQAAKYRPLNEARKNLKLHKVHGKAGFSMGPVHDPTPIARPRRREDDMPSPIKSTQEGSVAEETKAARIKYMQEKFGGDYKRWEREELAKASSTSVQASGPVQGHAVVALSLNDDLGPSNKVWTLDTVKKISSGAKQ